MTTTSKPRRITIAITDRRPVRILPADWPLIARAESLIEEGGCVMQIRFSVREHVDRRALVYGSFQFRGPAADLNRALQEGFYLDRGGNVVTALQHVAGLLIERAISTIGDARAEIRRVVADCTRKLPPEDLR